MSIIRPCSDLRIFELYKLLDEGVDAMKSKKVRPFRRTLADIQKDLQNEYIQHRITNK